MKKGLGKFTHYAVIDFKGLGEVHLELGPLVPVAMVRRLVKKSKTHVYRCLREGRLRTVRMMGQLFTPVADVKKIWPDS